jgi:hypothetical protein
VHYSVPASRFLSGDYYSDANAVLLRGVTALCGLQKTGPRLRLLRRVGDRLSI